MEKRVITVPELLSAVEDSRVGTIVVASDLAEVPNIDLLPGQTLSSLARNRYILKFARGAEGVRLSSDNSIVSLQLQVSPDKRAISNNCSVPTFGRTSLCSVSTVGRVQILAQGSCFSNSMSTVRSSQEKCFMALSMSVSCWE
jgi:hypothetical protein